MKYPLNEIEAKRPNAEHLNFRFPHDSGGLRQNEEWFEVELDVGWRRIRLHDYATLYRTPGLYESLVYERLKCRSPKRLVQLLCHVLENWSMEPDRICALDFGAGNGIVGERLREIDVKSVIGVDIITEAAEAASRDRPGVYDDYVTVDMCEISDGDRKRLQSKAPNLLITVAALGFGDIPPKAFMNAFNLIVKPGWLALTIKEEFLDERDTSGFAELLRLMVERKVINIEARMRISHRLSLAGEKLFYVALVARKLDDMPPSVIPEYK